MVVTTAAGNGVFLGQAQPRQCFTGIQQAHPSIGHYGRVMGTLGCGAGQGLHKVQCGALAGKIGRASCRESEWGVEVAAVVMATRETRWTTNVIAARRNAVFSR